MAKVIILRGIPGAGKSRFAERYGSEEKFIVSADRYFTTPFGEYSFDPRKLAEAHAYCFHQFLFYINPVNGWSRSSIVFVDNTNINLWEISPYILAANAHGSSHEILTIHADVATAYYRQVHGVSFETLERMERDLNKTKMLPFWNHNEVFTAEELSTY
jgi:hypothetical protein